MQNICIHFCLKLEKIHHISEKEFRSINCLPTSKKVDHCIKLDPTVLSIPFALII